MLSIQGVSLPATQSLLNYACLALIYGTCLILRRQRIQEAWWKYACLSLSECIATFSLVTAYRFTSLTSVTLLGCFSIPCKSVLTISWIKTHIWLGWYYFLTQAFSEHIERPIYKLYSDGPSVSQNCRRYQFDTLFPRLCHHKRYSNYRSTNTSITCLMRSALALRCQKDPLHIMTFSLQLDFDDLESVKNPHQLLAWLS